MILALGIAANTAIFSVVNSVLLAPLPYDDPDKLVVVKETNPSKTVERNSVSPGNFLDLQQEQLFDSVAAFYETSTTLQGPQDAEQVATAQVSVEFFKTLGVKPALGQPFPHEISGAAFEVGRFLSGERTGRYQRWSLETSLRFRSVDRWQEDHDQSALSGKLSA